MTISILEFDSLDDEELEDVNKLREWFAYHPQVMRDTWAMSRQALKALIDTASHEGEIPVNRVCLDGMLRQLHQDLASDTPSVLEWLAIDSLLFSWLSYWCAAYAYERKRDRLSTKQDALYQQRVNRWHRRFLADVRALAQLRKLGFPMSRSMWWTHR